MCNQSGSNRSLSDNDTSDNSTNVEPVVLTALFLVQPGCEGFGMLVVIIDDDVIRSHPSFANVQYYTFTFLDDRSRKLYFVLTDSQSEGSCCRYYFEPADDKIMPTSPADAMLGRVQSLVKGRNQTSDITALAFPPEMKSDSAIQSDTAHVVVLLKRNRRGSYLQSSVA